MILSPEDREVIDIGSKAEMLIENEHFPNLFEFVKGDLARKMMATDSDATKTRESLYQTYHAMDQFRSVLEGYIADYRAISDREDRDEFNF